MKCSSGIKWVLCLLTFTALSRLEVSADEVDKGSIKPVISPDKKAPLTLERSVVLALENSPELQVAKERIRAAAGRADQAGLWSNPELELSTEDWPVNRGGFSQAQNLAGVSQAVPFPGKKKLDREIGMAAIRTTEAELNLFRAELVRDVKVAFFKVLAAERLIAVSTELVKVAESSAESARKRVDAGAAADQELLRAEIPLEQAMSELFRLAARAGNGPASTG